MAFCSFAFLFPPCQVYSDYKSKEAFSSVPWCRFTAREELAFPLVINTAIDNRRTVINHVEFPVTCWRCESSWLRLESHESARSGKVSGEILHFIPLVLAVTVYFG